jgi:hypothetical protein
MPDFYTEQIITGILECEAATKQQLGQRLARHLHLEAGPAGKDDGIDGKAIHGTFRVLFQAKLRREEIGPDEAKIFWADIIRHRMNAGIYLAGIGFTTEFRRVSIQMEESLRSVGYVASVHFMALCDIIEQTQAFHLAKTVLPELSDVSDVFTQV